MTGKNQQALEAIQKYKQWSRSDIEEDKLLHECADILCVLQEHLPTIEAALKQPEVELRPLPESHHDYTDDNWFDAGWNACVAALQQPGDKT